MLEDIATLTGGKAITEDLGVKLENIKVEDLGKAKKVVVDKDNTTIVEGAGKPSAIAARIKQIRAQIAGRRGGPAAGGQGHRQAAAPAMPHGDMYSRHHRRREGAAS